MSTYLSLSPSLSPSDVLRRNGTAVDAVVATLFCNGAVHPHSMGIGGGFVMTVYLAGRDEAMTLVARELAPAAATRDMFANRTEGASRKGPLYVAVPGEVVGYYEAKQRFGSDAISWSSLVEPTIKMCREGVPVTASLAKVLATQQEREFSGEEGLRYSKTPM